MSADDLREPQGGVPPCGPADVTRGGCGADASGPLHGRGAVPVGTRPAYVDEEGVDPARGTETFAEVTLYVDNGRWAGVPFVLRTGKALAPRQAGDRRRASGRAGLAVRGRAPAPSNVLRFELSPDRLALDVNVNGAGDPFDLRSWSSTRTCPQDELPAYSRLLLDAIEGDPTLSIRDDEAEESWRIVEPILQAWQAGSSPLREYRAGSDGPSESRLTTPPPPDPSTRSAP